MAEENRFFRFLWRVDAILLALAGLLVIVMLGSVAITEWLRPRYAPLPEGNFRPVPRSAELNHTYRLEDQAEAASLPHEKMLALREWKGAPEGYGLAVMSLKASIGSSYMFTDAVNLLVIDTSSTKSRWLFSGYERRILSQESLYASGAPPQPPQTAIPIAVVIRSIDLDSNKDGTLDGRDVQSLYYYRPGDVRAVKFFSCNYILSEDETDDGNFLVVYEKGASAFAATYHLPDFKLVSQRQLPDVPTR